MLTCGSRNGKVLPIEITLSYIVTKTKYYNIYYLNFESAGTSKFTSVILE